MPLEAEKYQGYEKGIAFGNTHFKSGVVTERMPEEAKPVFVVTDDYIEFNGKRITNDKLDKLLALVA